MTIVGVAWAGDQASYEAFVSRHSLSFGNLDDTPGNIYGRYGVPFQPAWVFISRSGEAQRVQGGLDDSALESTLNELAAG